MSSSEVKVKRNLKALSLFLAFFAFNSTANAATFDGCDYVYNINPGYSYLESPYYPNSYPSGSSCRYRFVAPQDYYITINCTINLDKAANSCSTESFYVSVDGDTNLREAERFCGSGTFVRQSRFRSAVLAYASDGSWGNFRCSLYAQPQPCDCGWSTTTKIANGVEASVNEFPSMVAFRDIASNLPSYCGGSIVSHRFILSAAHCADYQPNTKYIVAMVGRHNLSAEPDTRYSAVYYISQIIKHPDYTSNPVNNDIALFYTTTDIDWSRGVGPICLPPANKATQTFAYATVTVCGWGTIFLSGPFSPTLQKVDLMVIENQYCKQEYNSTTPIYPTEMCTYDSTGNNKDTCQFDSGGPVILTKTREFLLGIISFGKSCAVGGYPVGVNARITAYLDWIHQYVDTCNVPL